MKRKNKADTLPGMNYSDKFNIAQCLASCFNTGLSYQDKDGQMHTFNPYPYKPKQYPIRNQVQNPYSYSPIIIWGEEKEKETAQYSDRLYQQNFEATEKMCLTHFGDRGQHFNRRIESFLKERLDYPNLKLHMIVEWCNVSSGYPYWSFHFTA
jgi:hypothetical protein